MGRTGGILLAGLRFLILAVGMAAVTDAVASMKSVMVYDGVAAVGHPLVLKVRTRGSLFPEGGCRVDLRVGEAPAGRMLTGGDGYGFLKFVPGSAGLKIIRATAADAAGRGRLLVLAPSEKAVVFELESGIREMFLSGETPSGIRHVIESVGRRYRVLFMTRAMGPFLARIILSRSGFSECVVVGYTGPDTFKRMKERGVKLHAVVGSPGVLSTVGACADRTFRFEEGSPGEFVDTWRELERRLADPEEKQEND